jgi:hypothetical protein
MYREATARASESPVVGGPSAPRTGLSPEDYRTSPMSNTEPQNRKATDSSIDDHHRCGREVTL